MALSGGLGPTCAPLELIEGLKAPECRKPQPRVGGSAGYPRTRQQTRFRGNGSGLGWTEQTATKPGWEESPGGGGGEGKKVSGSGTGFV